jgi:competence protein ComEC
MVPIWKNIPLLRVLLPLITGILTGWYLSLHWQIAVVAFIIALPFFLYLQFSGERSRFYNSWLDGLSFNIIFISLGIALVWLHQKPHLPNWAGHFYKDGDVVQLSLLEPLSEGRKHTKHLVK